MKPLWMLVLNLSVVAVAFGTAQDPEKLEYKKEVVDLYANPLETKLVGLHVLYGKNFTSGSSGNWRGYIGHWRIEDGFLLLTDLQAQGWIRKESGDLEQVSGTVPLKGILGAEATYPVRADWYSGTLRVPRGAVVQYVHMGYGSRFTEELFIEIKDGKVVKEYSIKYDPSKDAFRSHADMQWVAMGGLTEGENDGGQWVDGRLLQTASIASLIDSQKAFKTRGILFTDDELPHLWIPQTSKTKDATLPMNKLVETRIPDGSHVEIECKFYEMEDGDIGLEVSSMRELKPGETMHHTQFPKAWQKLEAALETKRSPNGAEQDADDRSATAVESKAQ